MKKDLLIVFKDPNLTEVTVENIESWNWSQSDGFLHVTQGDEKRGQRGQHGLYSMSEILYCQEMLRKE
jgi:hypothetical protein